MTNSERSALNSFLMAALLGAAITAQMGWVAYQTSRILPRVEASLAMNSVLARGF